MGHRSLGHLFIFVFFVVLAACGSRTPLERSGGSSGPGPGPGSDGGGPGPASCGNGVIDPGETCDGANVGGQTCSSLGLGDGRLGCNARCTLETGDCQRGGACGNGVIDRGEQCDGNQLGGQSCQSLGLPGGALRCSACSFETSGCRVPMCVVADLGDALGAPVTVSETFGAADDFASSCGNFDVPDSAFFWTAPNDGCFRFDTRGSPMDTVLMLEGSCSGPELACDDDGGGDVSSLIETELGQGESVFIVVEGFNPGEEGPFQLNIERCSGDREFDCFNGRDDDGDGLTDCEDPDCAAFPECGMRFENCFNGQDDDGDGRVDCDDPDCQGSPACPFPFEDCGNGVDDDGDRLVDCADPDCNFSPQCPPRIENACRNGMDDDGDGLTDCEDPDCSSRPFCARSCPRGDLGSELGSPVITGNTQGSSDDFGASCAAGADSPDDPFSWTAPTDGCFEFNTVGSNYDTALTLQGSCMGPEISCDDDAGGSLQSRIQRPFFAGERVVVVVDGFNGGSAGQYALNILSCDPEVNCTDGRDNDGDMLVDCADPDCAGNPGCSSTCPMSDLGSALGDALAVGNTQTQSNDFDAPCAGGGGSPDIAFAWRAPADGCFQFDTNGSGYDTALTIRPSCVRPIIACDDDGGTAPDSLIQLDVRAGQDRIIVVDGFSDFSSGFYQLNINPC